MVQSLAAFWREFLKKSNPSFVFRSLKIPAFSHSARQSLPEKTGLQKTYEVRDQQPCKGTLHCPPSSTVPTKSEQRNRSDSSHDNPEPGSHHFFAPSLPPFLHLTPSVSCLLFLSPCVPRLWFIDISFNSLDGLKSLCLHFVDLRASYIFHGKAWEPLEGFGLHI